MLILHPHTPLGAGETLDAAVFDFDGTLSKLRAGWESVMEPLMCELIPGDREEVTALASSVTIRKLGMTGTSSREEIARLDSQLDRNTGRR